MGYEIETREIASQRIASIREKTTVKELSSTLEKLFGEVFNHLQSREVTGAHPPVALYHDFSEQSVDVEAGLPVPDDFKPEGRIATSELPAGRVAVAVHIGPYDKLPEAYDAIQKWLADNGRQIAGPPWEVYVTDPGEEPDSSKWKTEVFWPIA